MLEKSTFPKVHIEMVLQVDNLIFHDNINIRIKYVFDVWI